MNRIAFISDIHGNLPALEAVLSDIEEKGISEIYCLGDIVGYYCYFNEVVQILKEKEVVCLLGNHDDAYVFNDGYIDRSRTCTKILKWQLDNSDKGTLDFLKDLPRSLEIILNDYSVKLVHGGLVDTTDEYLFSVTNEYLIENDFKQKILISGHTHLAAYKKFLSGKIWINPGSVGQPRDRDPRASYAILNTDFTFEFVRVHYNASIVINEMRSRGFDDYISTGLLTGSKIG